ncbi:MAG: aminotransferase DegT [Deltaproteobacteria bacterium CG_4_10_14_0_2_um_filter_43_8]|nr:MAG: aminotransferase DegT [Deltaproteobacteria bacterium CG11_big_fil_rev_8_21_14_0_20_42_23]PJA18673.1 MAG: aminotransferase DegT [Deltaproteobacteria bacterium CG_4_10_14_0_2_um_filter_43_8]PJC64544.1 MAG: aminotransferase DegT [Deltaproteobacteria bacterium CG_4_9_14_0_2_um_filter_42_21]
MNDTSSQSSLVRRTVDAIQAVVGLKPVVLHEPKFSGNEWIYIKQCLDSTFVSSVGEFVDRFEADLSHYTGAKHAVAVMNGTAALHVALRLAGVQSGDEVLIPTLTFVATANAVVYSGGTPHFVESNERTLGVDPYVLREYLRKNTELRGKQCVNCRTGCVIRALVPMHTFGHPVDIEGILAVARDFYLTVVEDAAESLGSTVCGRHTGTFGLMGTLSFNGNKTITTGGGGAILTNDSALARRAKHLTTTAKLLHRWDFIHDEVGYNYRMPNINAALGCAQLEQLPDLLAAKRQLFQRYQAAFAGIPQLKIFSEPAGCCSNYWLQTMLLDKSVAAQRDAILTSTNDEKIMTRPVWNLMHHLTPYRECPKMELPVAESLANRLINLPSSAHLVTEPKT